MGFVLLITAPFPMVDFPHLENISIDLGAPSAGWSPGNALCIVLAGRNSRGDPSQPVSFTQSITPAEALFALLQRLELAAVSVI